MNCNKNVERSFVGRCGRDSQLTLVGFVVKRAAKNTRKENGKEGGRLWKGGD